MEDNLHSSNKNKLSVSLDYRLIIILLLVIIGVMLAIWRPWSSQPTATDRTIKVTGDATVKSEPDEYVFMPNYDFKDVSKATALANLTKKNDEVVKALKSLGVADNKIKNNASGNNYDYFFDQTSNQYSYTLQLTITVNDKALTQKVQDYLVTTDPTGQVSPQADFSEAKRKQLESTARDEATTDARKKADQSAKNLGFKITKVKSVDDGTGFGQVYPLSANMAVGSTLDAKSVASPSLAVQSGENDLSYSVTVVYYVK